TTRSDITLAGPSVPPPNPSSSSSKKVERDPETTIDQVHISSPESTARVSSSVIQPAPASKPNEIPERNPHQPPIPYPSRLNKENLQDKSNIQIHKFLQMFKKLHFNISFAKALAMDVSCNMRILKSLNPTTNNLNNEVDKTIEVGSSIGYDMRGKEIDVRRIIGDEILLMVFLQSTGNGLNMKYCLMVVVYAPQDIRKKQTLWNNITDLVLRFNAPSVVLGDFNEVRYETKRKGSRFCKRGAKLFNDFIYNSHLVDLPMGGRKFTRMNKFDTKLSKIDRILVSHQFTNRWPNAHITILPREASDHYPILLKSYAADYGPIPFKFFNTWLLDSEFQNMFIESWVSLNSSMPELSTLCNTPKITTQLNTTWGATS
ncbi:cytochrome P450, partial [Tanacetum coccineum]